MVMTSVFVASQSASFVFFSREQIQPVENSLTLAATTLLARSIASILHVSSDSKNCIRKLE